MHRVSVFTGGGSWGGQPCDPRLLCTVRPPKGRKHIITSRSSIMRGALRLRGAGEGGLPRYLSEYMEDKEGRVDLEQLKNELSEDTHWFPLWRQTRDRHDSADQSRLPSWRIRFGAKFHTDAVQAVGHMHIDVQEMGIDMLSPVRS